MVLSGFGYTSLRGILGLSRVRPQGQPLPGPLSRNCLINIRTPRNIPFSHPTTFWFPQAVLQESIGVSSAALSLSFERSDEALLVPINPVLQPAPDHSHSPVFIRVWVGSEHTLLH